MATMKEIAELSGVSRGTVDRVLNHRGIVNAETERKVLEIAKLLDYQPNKAGIALAAQKKKLKIGVLLSAQKIRFLMRSWTVFAKNLKNCPFTDVP